MANTRKPAAKSGRAKSTATKPRAAAGTTTRRKAATPDRASDGRFKPDHHVRNAAFGATAALGAVAAGVAVAFKFGLLDRFLPRSLTGGEGHDAEDLLIDAPDQRGNDADTAKSRRRAPKAFRPDMDAPMTKAEREALRPAEGPAPAFAAESGTTVG